MAICERYDNLGADGAPAKLGIMGGTFDPIHMGHLRIAEEVREALELDVVLFIPAGIPVYKRDQHVTDAEVRFAQVRTAIADNPHFDISHIEIDRQGDTFTVDTLRQLRAHFPENVKLFFITGSDSAMTIGQWRSSREIAKLASLAVAVGRPGTAGADELREAILSAAPFDLHLVRATTLEISSTNIRERLRQGKSVRYLVAPGFDATAYTTGKDTDEKNATGESSSDAAPKFESSRPLPSDSDDPLSDAFYQARKAELQQRVGPKRFEHSMGVSAACEQLAECYGLDVRKALLAGLLHDWDKGMDDNQARARVYELGMQDDIDPWVMQNMPRVLHGYTAARALARDFPQIPADVLQAIDRHTTAALDMSPLDMALYIADAIEPGRQFGRIDELRAQVGKVSLDELYFQTYEYWTFLLFERRKPLHPDTMRIWNENVLRWQQQKEAGAKSKNGKAGKNGKKNKKKREA